MRQKKYPKILLTLLLILMLTIVLPIQQVSGNVLKLSYGFEVTPIGDQVTEDQSGFFTTRKISGGTCAVSSTAYNGARGYTVGQHNQATTMELNITRQIDGVVAKFSFYNKIDMNRNSIYYTFFNRTLGIEKPIIIVRIFADGYGDQYFAYNDSLNAHHTFLISGVSLWNLFNVEILSDVGDVRYSMVDTSSEDVYNVTGTSRNDTAIYEGYVIDSVRLRSTFNNPYYAFLHIDDFSISISDSYSGKPLLVGCIDTTGLTQVGYFGSSIRDVQAQRISKTYNVMVDTTIKGIELQVSIDQITRAGDLGNYNLRINGMSLGMPSCSVLLEAYGILQWVTDTTITNNVVNFEFTHTKKTDAWYWQTGIGATSTTDLDGDGDIWFMQHRHETTYEWAWFWIFPYQKPIYDAYAEIVNYDLAVRWWCEGFNPPPGIGYDYKDDIGLSKYVRYNNVTQTYIYNLSRKNHDTIFGGYTLNDPVASYLIRLYGITSDFNLSNRTEIRTLHWPHVCRYPGSTFGYAPANAGHYVIELIRDSTLVRRLNITIEGTPGDYSIRTSPPISNQYETYEVLWRYYQAQGHTGRVGMMSIHKDALINYVNTEVTIPPIQPNTTGSYSHYSVSPSAEYWGLYVYANNQYILYAETTHIIRIPSIFENTIRPLLDNCDIGVTNQLIGTHRFPGADIRVYVNNVLIGHVGDSQNYLVSYTTAYPGIHTAQLRIYLDNGSQVLAQCTFNVRIGDMQPPKPDSRDWDWLKLIPSEYVPLIGIALIAGMAMLPLISLTSLQKKVNVQIHVPDKVMIIICTITGFTGYMLTLYWGIFQWWTIFMILFSFILILAILYYSGHRDGGGSGGTN